MEVVKTKHRIFHSSLRVHINPSIANNPSKRLESRWPCHSLEGTWCKMWYSAESRQSMDGSCDYFWTIISRVYCCNYLHTKSYWRFDRIQIKICCRKRKHCHLLFKYTLRQSILFIFLEVYVTFHSNKLLSLYLFYLLCPLQKDPWSCSNLYKLILPSCLGYSFSFILTGVLDFLWIFPLRFYPHQ